MDNVTQADRNAAIEASQRYAMACIAEQDERHEILAQHFAAHRIASQPAPAGDVAELVGKLAALEDWLSIDGSNYFWLPVEVRDLIVSTLTSQQAELDALWADKKAGEDAAFNHGLIVAASDLLNIWGDTTQAGHLLGMANATTESVKAMDLCEHDLKALLPRLKDMEARALKKQGEA